MAQVNEDLPLYLVGGGYDMLAGGDQAAGRGRELARVSPHGRSTPPEALDLAALLSQTLLVFARDYESGRRVALALNANVLRILTEEGGQAHAPGAPGAAVLSGTGGGGVAGTVWGGPGVKPSGGAGEAG